MHSHSRTKVMLSVNNTDFLRVARVEFFFHSKFELLLGSNPGIIHDCVRQTGPSKQMKRNKTNRCYFPTTFENVLFLIVENWMYCSSTSVLWLRYFAFSCSLCRVMIVEILWFVVVVDRIVILFDRRMICRGRSPSPKSRHKLRIC